jgi:hypothetical protein
VTRVYLDPSALLLAPAETDGATSDDHLAPGAVEAILRLVDAGYEVLILGGEDGQPLPGRVGRSEDLPDHLGDAWFLTADARPALGRPRGGTTVLVGPRRTPGRLPLPRFDLEARDLASAAMEILTRDAMA